ncbi:MULTISPECIES: hypothetical protein [Burkholderia]|uniref:hypothetical protein n=1 Tax=Burkholderia TaxID=32008 RepID=UPI000A57054E|nr:MULTISPECIES: hypothetical protein [Burkholderia]
MASILGAQGKRIRNASPATVRFRRATPSIQRRADASIRSPIALARNRERTRRARLVAPSFAARTGSARPAPFFHICQIFQ